MTIEEQLAKLQDEFEAVKANNKELIGEKRKLQQKLGEIDFDEYNKALSERDEYKDKFTKLSKDFDTKNKEFESLSNALSEKDNYLKNLTLENALNENLAKIGVKSEYSTAVKALLKSQAKVEDNNVIIGDKSINDFMTEWQNGEGKAFIAAPANSGSGANGGQGGQNVQKLSDLSESERIALYKTDPIKFNQLVKGL